MPAFPEQPQAKLPTFLSIGQEIRNINRSKQLSIEPYRIVALTGGATADIVFDRRAGSEWGDRFQGAKLVLHNLGANAMAIGLNTDAKLSANTYHDIIAGGTVVKDGLGSQIDLSDFDPEYVTVNGTAGELVGVLIAYPMDQRQVGS